MQGKSLPLGILPRWVLEKKKEEDKGILHCMVTLKLRLITSSIPHQQAKEQTTDLGRNILPGKRCKMYFQRKSTTPSGKELAKLSRSGTYFQVDKPCTAK